MWGPQQQEEADYQPQSSYDLCVAEAKERGLELLGPEEEAIWAHLRLGHYVVVQALMVLTPYDTWVQCGREFVKGFFLRADAEAYIAEQEALPEWDLGDYPPSFTIVEPDWDAVYGTRKGRGA